MDVAAVAQVRAFNRTVGERIGALSERFLGRERPYGESRILWEVGPAGIDVRELRTRLGLDSGYVSRMLGALERAGLITIGTSRGDKRLRHVRWTRSGRAECAELDRRSDAIAWSFLQPLGDEHRATLVAAMAQVERLLRASMVEIAVEQPTTPAARWCIAQYVSELNKRFEAGWDPSRSISADPHELAPPAGLLLVARLRGNPVACGALKFHPKAPTELKRMWVAPEARGIGLGRRLLQELERQARHAGTRIVRLETNRSLKEAIQLYRTSGYREVERFNDEPYAHHWFEKVLA
jgi:DNA-binding MarR family transcriptional regulator/GNAT superfamily N-acetyltransferase